MNITYKELKEQYYALSQTFDYLNTRKSEIINLYHQTQPKSLLFVGSGSSYCLAQSGELSAQLRLGVRANAFAAGDLMLNYEEYQTLLEDGLIVVLSRSGSTSEILLALDKIRQVQNIPVLTITCTEDSKLAKRSDLALEIPWAFDQSVCQTRSVINLYMANLLVLAYLSGDQRLMDDIVRVIKAGNDYMALYEDKLKEVAAEAWSEAIILADGEIKGIASEGALAFSEIAEVPGRFYHVLDVRHGPMVLINQNSLAIVSLTKAGFNYQRDLVLDLLKKGVKVITYSDVPLDPIPGVRGHISSGQQLDPAVRGINFIFIPQILAYYKAVQKGVNPDQPAGLSPWIKL